MRGAPLLVAHRAGNDPAGVAPAVVAGADLIEIDVHLRRGTLEVRHPRRLGPILWDSAGVRLARGPAPHLDEVLQRLPPGAEPMLDLKQGPPELAARALDACRRRGIARLTIASRRWGLIDGLGDEPGLRRVHSSAGRRELERLVGGAGRSVEVVCARRDLLTAATVRRLLGVAEGLMTWPVHDAADAAVLAGWGVGGLICDDLGLVAQLAAGRGTGEPRTAGH